jgi:hypothetical protein
MTWPPIRSSAGVTKEQSHAATAAGKARIKAIEALENSAMIDPPLTPLIGTQDIEAAWTSLSLSYQRLVVDTLVTIRIVPVASRGRGFDPATADIRLTDRSVSQAKPGGRKRKPRRSSSAS